MEPSPSPLAPAAGPLVASWAVPAVFAATPAAARRTLEFFAVNIRNPHTRRAYARAVGEFGDWCGVHGLHDVRDVQPLHVATYLEGLHLAAPSVKQRLAALRMLFDWLVLGQVMPSNPASPVRGPRHVVKQGQTPVLSAEEARVLLDSIGGDTLLGLRDRALIGLMVYTFARVGAALQMRVGDVFVQGRRTWVRLHEKGGKAHTMPCHRDLEAWLLAYKQGAALEGPKGFLFRAAVGRSGRLSDRPLAQGDVFRMVARRAAAAGIGTHIGCHSLRATGITTYLQNGGRLEVAQQMANHESPRTTGLYDRRAGSISLDEVERIVF